LFGDFLEMRHGVRKELTERNDILKKYQAS
jgi:hypothetical protein